MGLTVTQLATPTVVRIHHCPLKLDPIYIYMAIRLECLDVFRIDCGSSSVDRALAFQAEGRGFESRLPLFLKRANDKN